MQKISLAEQRSCERSHKLRPQLTDNRVVCPCSREVRRHERLSVDNVVAIVETLVHLCIPKRHGLGRAHLKYHSLLLQVQLRCDLGQPVQLVGSLLARLMTERNLCTCGQDCSGQHSKAFVVDDAGYWSMVKLALLLCAISTRPLRTLPRNT